MSKFTIKRTGFWRKPRLVASEQLWPVDFDSIAAALHTKPLRARKVAPVAATRADREQAVVTIWRGEETKNIARIGDWIVTSLDRDRNPMKDDGGNTNTYVIKPEKFEQLYERSSGETAQLGQNFRPKGVVDALAFSGGFDIKAPWGERQTGTAGYLLRNGSDIYGNQKKTFEEAYEVVTED